MSYGTTELTELVCTRISHDLIGNIGAISSALELIEENDNILDDDTKAILNTGANTLRARQKFFRLAFGIDSKKCDMTELLSVCEDYLTTIGNRNNPIKLNLSQVSSEIAKFVCLGIMCAAEVFIKSGEISVAMNKNNMIIKAVSDYKFSANKIAIYNDIINGEKPSENASQYVQLIYLKELLGADVPLSLQTTENEFLLIVG